MNESGISLSGEYNRIVEQVRSKQEHHKRRQQPRRQEASIELQQQPQQQTPQQMQQLIIENNSLKDYIEELCDYINDTSGRYSRNVEKLTKEYEQLYLKLADSHNRFDEQRLLSKNQLVAERDIKLAREQELARLRQELSLLEANAHQRQLKIEGLKQEIEEKWNESQRQKQLWSDVLNNLEKQHGVQAAEISELNQRLHQRNNETESLKEKIAALQNDLTARYSLPDKIQNCERKIVRDETTIDSLRQQLGRTERELDIVKAELSKVNRQREELRIRSVKYEESFEIFFSGKIKEYENRWEEERRQLITTNNRLKLQLEQSELEMKRQVSLVVAQHEQLVNCQSELTITKKELSSESHEKQSYLGEFRVLKKNYEGVIRNLEEGFKELQQKNWDLEEQKKDLEEEVEKFRELVKELANINEFATAGSSEYYVRQISKLQQTAPTKIRRQDYVLAREQAHREVAAQRFNEGSKKVPSATLTKLLEEQDDDSNDQWSKLIQGINSLKVSK